MMISGTVLSNGWKVSALAVAMVFAGCKSDQEKANDAAVAQAKQLAATNNTAQQVVTTDKDGSLVTTVVQPPAPGQTTQQIVVTKTSRSTSTTKVASQPASSQPVVGPVGPIASANQPSVVAGAQPVAQAPAGTTITPVDVQVPAGTTLAIRINQRISVKTAHVGERFTGELVNAVMVRDSNTVAIPRGTPVAGVIDASHRRGHFKGRSILGLRLTSMELNGQRYALDTADNVRTKKGKGKRSAAFIGGGTGAGMLVGGLATGGVGLVVGGLAGAGLGTALGGLTGNRDLVIPAESVVNFRLADDLVVRPQ